MSKDKIEIESVGTDLNKIELEPVTPCVEEELPAELKAYKDFRENIEDSLDLVAPELFRSAILDALHHLMENLNE